MGLADSFEAIADPAKVASGKPAPDIFLIAAKALDLDPKDCIGVEDAVAGVTAINASGATSIAIGGSELSHATKRYNSTSELDFKEIVEAWKKNQH